MNREVKLLVSPKDEDEALEAVSGGADIIDVKNPSEGSLGANFPWVIRRIRKLVPRNIEVSATLGDLPNLPGTASLAALGAAAVGANYVKVGLLGPSSFSDAVFLMGNVVRSVKEWDPSIKVVAAAYADWKRTGTLDPLLIPEIAAKSGSHVAMIDTKLKDGRRLFDFLTSTDLDLFVERSHDRGLSAALAGSLQKADVSILTKLKVDVIGVRTAVCEGLNRVSGRISRWKVRELIDAIKETESDTGLKGNLARGEVVV